MAAHLIGQDATRLGEPGGAAGPVLETFVGMEIARQLTWSDTRARQYHYRAKDKVEVDVVLETPDGRVVGLEVKAGATVRTENLTGLRNLASQAGDRGLRALHRASNAAVRGKDQGASDGRAVAPRAVTTAPRCDDSVPAASLLRHSSTCTTDLARLFSDGIVEQADTEYDNAPLMVLGSASDDTLSRRAGEAVSAIQLHATDLGLATRPLSRRARRLR